MNISAMAKSPTCYVSRSIQFGRGSSARGLRCESTSIRSRRFKLRQREAPAALRQQPQRRKVRPEMGSNLHPVEPEELMAYLDGESPHDRAAATAAHLEECRECQMLAAEMLRVSESLRAWQIETAEWAINEELAKAFEERE